LLLRNTTSSSIQNGPKHLKQSQNSTVNAISIFEKSKRIPKLPQTFLWQCRISHCTYVTKIHIFTKSFGGSKYCKTLSEKEKAESWKRKRKKAAVHWA
jgi:hypothetical protein